MGIMTIPFPETDQSQHAHADALLREIQVYVTPKRFTALGLAHGLGHDYSMILEQQVDDLVNRGHLSRDTANPALLSLTHKGWNYECARA
jgi:hypothetical protein